MVVFQNTIFRLKPKNPLFYIFSVLTEIADFNEIKHLRNKQKLNKNSSCILLNFLLSLSRR